MLRILMHMVLVFTLSACGGGERNKDSFASPIAIDLALSCKYIGGNIYFPSLDVFCSINDFKEAYPGAEPRGFYFKLGNRDVLIASFIGFEFVEPIGRITSKKYLRDLFILLSRGTDYSKNIIVANDLDSHCQSNVEILSVDTQYSGVQKLYEYCSRYPKKSNLAVIYMEGHGGSALDIGFDNMDFLASQGYRVFYLDLPLTGSNSNGLLISHHDLGYYEQIGSGPSPIYSEFIYPVGKFIEYLRDQKIEVMLFGRSGGGWRSYVAGSLYDVDYVVSVAGGTPHSMRLSAPWNVYELGDWEQFSPSLYSFIGHEDFMKFSGVKGSAFVFNMNDPCCFRVKSSDLFISWLIGVGAPSVNVYVDESNLNHSLGSDGRQFLINTFRRWGI